MSQVKRRGKGRGRIGLIGKANGAASAPTEDAELAEIVAAKEGTGGPKGELEADGGEENT